MLICFGIYTPVRYAWCIINNNFKQLQVTLVLTFPTNRIKSSLSDDLTEGVTTPPLVVRNEDWQLELRQLGDDFTFEQKEKI